MTPPARSTRDRLLAAAGAQVSAHGVAGTTSRQIAAAAGTNLQAITYHFGSKDALVAEALTGAVRAWVAPVRELLTGLPDDPEDVLATALDQLDATVRRVADQVPAYLEALAAAPRHPEFAARISPLFAELRTDVTAAISGLCDAGLLGDWVVPEALAGLVVAAADGVAIHLTVDRDGPSPTALLDQAAGLLLAALRRPGN